MARGRNSSKSEDLSGAVPAEQLQEVFPPIDLPIRPPFPPMEARTAVQLPESGDWLYEPKWDGFRGLAFRKNDDVLLQSKAGQPLGRYFPELIEALRALPQRQFVLDGEIVILSEGHLDFNALLQRIHPAESRIRRLATETPVTFLSFDVLVNADGKLLTDETLERRKTGLKEFFDQVGKNPTVRLSPSTRDLQVAQRWMGNLATVGFDGVVAKKLEETYLSGERSGMVKVKRLRTADCVVGGFRYASKGEVIGSMLLGLHDEQGRLNHVGFTSSFKAEERVKLVKTLEPYITQEKQEGFSGNAPGGPSRWATERSTEWVPLQNKLVCEVQYDHFSGGRFRHGCKFLRWRPDKSPEQCTYEQVIPGTAGDLEKLLVA
ncbi:MAG TPA: ATP-dependent DNA ligase [Terriglobales bacterium]|jgi:ATP-dependent DNA ligase|nr:ATP-dependent DNA ligase [Terriglobales bacterium]